MLHFIKLFKTFNHIDFWVCQSVSSWIFRRICIFNHNWIQLSTPLQILHITSYLLTHRVENFRTQFEPFWVHWGVYSKEQNYMRGAFHLNLICFFLFLRTNVPNGKRVFRWKINMMDLQACNNQELRHVYFNKYIKNSANQIFGLRNSNSVSDATAHIEPHRLRILS